MLLLTYRKYNTLLLASGELQFTSNRLIGNIGAPLRGMDEEFSCGIGIEGEEYIRGINDSPSEQSKNTLMAEKRGMHQYIFLSDLIFQINCQVWLIFVGI